MGVGLLFLLEYLRCGIVMRRRCQSFSHCIGGEGFNQFCELLFALCTDAHMSINVFFKERISFVIVRRLPHALIPTMSANMRRLCRAF